MADRPIFPLLETLPQEEKVGFEKWLADHLCTLPLTEDGRKGYYSIDYNRFKREQQAALK